MLKCTGSFGILILKLSGDKRLAQQTRSLVNISNLQYQESIVRTNPQLCMQCMTLTSDTLSLSQVWVPDDRSTGPTPCRSATVRNPDASKDCRRLGASGKLLTSWRGAAIDDKHADQCIARSRLIAVPVLQLRDHAPAQTISKCHAPRYIVCALSAPRTTSSGGDFHWPAEWGGHGNVTAYTRIAHGGLHEMCLSGKCCRTLLQVLPML